MKSFFHSIWPLTIPPQIDPDDEIAVLRERILQAFLLTSLRLRQLYWFWFFPHISKFNVGCCWGCIVFLSC